MTTFIDFRYSASQVASLSQSYLERDAVADFEVTGEKFLVLEFGTESSPRILATLGSLTLALEQNGTVVFRSDDSSVKVEKTFIQTRQVQPVNEFVGIRFGGASIGLRRGTTTSETVLTNEAVHSFPIKLEAGVRIVGAESGRAQNWAKIYYQRLEPTGVCIEVVMDWLNVHSGIPTNAIATVEEMLRQSNFKIALTSYSCDVEEARASDFYRLFASEARPAVTFNIAPPSYVSVNPDTINIGLFVVESTPVSPSITNQCNQMDLIIVPTTFVQKALRASGVTQPIDVIPHGVDLDFFVPVSSKQPLESGKKFNILAVAAFSERKNIYHLARAYMEEFGVTEDIALHLYIRPEYLTTQNNLMQGFYEWENWHFNESGLILVSTSYVSRSHLRNLYANADLYLMPSNEGFGFTLLESMACGTAAVGLGHGGQTDFLNEETGYTVAPGERYISKNMDMLPYVGDIFVAPDKMHLRRLLRSAFENQSEVLARGKKARAYVEKRFSWASVGCQIVASIQTAIEKHSAARSTRLVVKNQLPSALTWIVGVIDDEAVTPALKSLNRFKKLIGPIVCLFTRYGNVRDALHARRQGLLLYRWDTTFTNFSALADQLAKSPWVGLLYGTERLEGNLQSLLDLLAKQPKDVTEVKVKVGTGPYEARLFRRGTFNCTGRSVECADVLIR